MTLPQAGWRAAGVFCIGLVAGDGVLIVFFILWQSASLWPWLFLPGYLSLIRAAWVVQVSEEPQRLNHQLKLTALGSLACNLLLALGFTLAG